jgi:hypothetical protein
MQQRYDIVVAPAALCVRGTSAASTNAHTDRCERARQLSYGDAPAKGKTQQPEREQTKR